MGEGTEIHCRLNKVNYIEERLKRRKSFGDYKEELITGIKINISANNSINIPFISPTRSLPHCGGVVHVCGFLYNNNNFWEIRVKEIPLAINLCNIIGATAYGGRAKGCLATIPPPPGLIKLSTGIKYSSTD